MVITELIDKLLELPADAKVKGELKWDETKEELTLVRSNRKKQPKTDNTEIQTLMDNPEARFNFREFLLAWGVLYREIRGTNITISFPRDTGILKNTFPTVSDFGHSELKVLRTYLEIFDQQIKTPTYKQPTLGGLRYAMQKVNQAMAKQKIQQLQDKNKQYELTEEVF